MAEWLTYLLESSICLGGFYLVYHLGLRRLSFFGWNRAILLLGLVLSLLLPLGEWQVEWLPASNRSLVSAETNAVLPEVATEAFRARQTELPDFLPASSPALVPGTASPADPGFGWPSGWQILFALWLSGAVVVAARLGRRYLRLWRYSRRWGSGPVVIVPPGTGSFSFARRIFLDESGLNAQEREMVLAHERAHLRLGHGWDNLVLGLSQVVWWFHPVLPLWRKALRSIHEYQADAAAVTLADPLSYSRLLLRLAGRRARHTPAHAFASSKAGLRIEMLHQNPSSPMSRSKYLLLLPLLTLLSFSFVLVPGEPSFVSDATLTSADTQADLEFAGEAIPTENPAVQARFDAQYRKLKANASFAAKALDRSRIWKSRILPILAEEGIPSDFFYLAVSESLLDPAIKSKFGAVGMWQFMPATARNCGLTVNEQVDQRTDWRLSTRAACRYLRDSHRELGSWTAAAVAYNKGVPGYRKLLQKHQASSYFDVQAENETYLYRVLAFKQLLHPNLRGEAVDIEPTTIANPPSIPPLDAESGMRITSTFGKHLDHVTKKEKQHHGLDLAAPLGTPVLAPAAGKVIEVGEDKLNGKVIVLQHDATYTTRYHHLDEILIGRGEQVSLRQVIGKVGSTGRSTGPHLHYEVLKDGSYVDPEDYL